MMALKKNIRLYAGVCPGCGLYLWRYLNQISAKNPAPGVFLRCAECEVSTYARPVRSHTIRQDPDWVVDSEQVDEWFDPNMVDLGGPGTGHDSLAAADGGEKA